MHGDLELPLLVFVLLWKIISAIKCLTKLTPLSFSLIAAILPATAYAATYNVSVGANGTLAYDPPYVRASVGDTINFNFYPKNHTVTQSSFNAPCVPLTDGVDSDFMPVNASQVHLPTFQLSVEDTSPIWISCRQTGHCGKGMVFAVNPGAEGSSNSFSAFRALAISTNGTASSSAATVATTNYTPPPAQSWTTATATVTHGTTSWLTTYTSYDGTPAPTFAPQPVDHKIVVGNNGQLEYGPANISASIGDSVTFQFNPKNHTVTQSSFQHPCQRLAETSTSGQVGFSSGFRPVAANATDFPTFQITINDTAPIWGYCAQTSHCGSGMVFSINAVETGPNNFAAFRALAIQTNGTGTGAGGNSTSASVSASGSGSGSGNNSDSSSGSGVDNGALSMSGDIKLMSLGGLLYVVALLL
ncbi:uncharacterized protein BT62DRAFT_216235 [Guyanagaster necrorhizus]|uniref:Cupredoxin n=1 Tax=Guyanagaster necrorhizus TaxID=856835 RepID=A0A9P8AS85_9AGAR|nr:uncharacterized protein BT62DRAFT_216235 [Guyanagaster necrorhizus MCA 3950]KAG7444607.1 hypothetical protein BT62DRAFT_216235 [Guyanagaster necrorhizus MCA 3950]